MYGYGWTDIQIEKGRETERKTHIVRRTETDTDTVTYIYDVSIRMDRHTDREKWRDREKNTYS